MTPQRLTTVQRLAAYGIALVVMSLLDGIWLGWLARDFYQKELGTLMADSIRWAPAAAYYLLYPAAIVFLALTPTPASLGTAVLRSAALGLTAFGVYDLTNLATLRGYTVAMAAVDMAWGTFATALGGAAAHTFISSRSRAR